MTPEKMLGVIDLYRKRFEEQKIGKIDFPHEEYLCSGEQALPHCHGMLDQMTTFIHEGRMDKVFRWLGFIQGCLWAARLYTINELKDHNRP